MKNRVIASWVLPALLVSFNTIQLLGQTFKTLHAFTSRDGIHPIGGLSLSGQTLDGTLSDGSLVNGTLAEGTVFAINLDGTGFTNLHYFMPYPSVLTNADGAHPYAAVILCGNTLYGTASYGGTSARGTVYRLNTDGTSFTNLHNFAGHPDDADYPHASLISSGNTLYGVASGSSGAAAIDSGSVFAINTDGTDFRTLHIFGDNWPPLTTNVDGATPNGGLVLSDGVLYGTTLNGGASNEGTVFSVNTDGSGFSTLHR